MTSRFSAPGFLEQFPGLGRVVRVEVVEVLVVRVGGRHGSAHEGPQAVPRGVAHFLAVDRVHDGLAHPLVVERGDLVVHGEQISPLLVPSMTWYSGLDWNPASSSGACMLYTRSTSPRSGRWWSQWHRRSSAASRS